MQMRYDVPWRISGDGDDGAKAWLTLSFLSCHYHYSGKESRRDFFRRLF